MVARQSWHPGEFVPCEDKLTKSAVGVISKVRQIFSTTSHRRRSSTRLCLARGSKSFNAVIAYALMSSHFAAFFPAYQSARLRLGRVAQANLSSSLGTNKSDQGKDEQKSCRSGDTSACLVLSANFTPAPETAVDLLRSPNGGATAQALPRPPDSTPRLSMWRLSACVAGWRR